jgi:pyruvate kinase
MDATKTFLKTKIVCTIGPGSSDPQTLKALCAAGMDVARLNMSHATPESVREMAQKVRAAAAESGRTVGVLVDLQGPKIRVGRLDGEMFLEPGDVVVLAPAEAARDGDLPVTYPDLAKDLSKDNRVLLADGSIELKVRSVDAPRVEAEVVMGGKVTTGRGINLPGVHVGAPSLTEKDLADLEVAVEIEADYLALSFVRSAQNLKDLRDRVPESQPIMAKIEKEAALDDFASILDAADAIMVARGDLGTELPFEMVPLAQKRIVRMANARCRPVVIATEMLESMIVRPRPTRAEVSDVANAILDGTDAVMLSAETAVGNYPVESVRALTRVIAEVEARSVMLAGGPPYDVPDMLKDTGPATTEVAVAGATLDAVRATQAPAIVTLTSSGHTARVVSSRRPPVPVLAVTDKESVLRQLALAWGVLPLLCRAEPTYDNMLEVARAELARRSLAAPGDRVVVTAGMPFHVSGTTNMIRIETI